MKLMNLEAIKKQPIKHIFIYSVPAIIAMVLSSFVTVVDGVFVANFIGKEALASINLGMPIIFIYLALSIMIGVGGASIAGRRLGAKDFKGSINIFNQTLITGLLSFLSLSVLIYLCINPILNRTVLTADTKTFILDYFNIMIWVYPIMMINMAFGMFLRGEGKPQLFMLNTIITTVLNMTLDYVFIAKLNLGVRGAAAASCLAVLVGFIIMIGYFMSSKTLYHISKFKFSKIDFKNTLANGSSEFIGQMSMFITVLFFNTIIISRMGLTGVAAMTIIGYSRYIYNMIVVGFGQGLGPMVSFSFGAGEINIGLELRKQTQKLVMIMGSIFFILLNLGSKGYAQIFTNDIQLIRIIDNSMWIFSFTFLFCGYNVISSFYFTSIGKAKQSAIISSMRGLVILSVNIYILPSIFGTTGIWLVSPCTELATFAIAFYLIKNLKIKGSNEIKINIDKRA